MEIIHGKNICFRAEKPVGVGLGNFDGLHIGHMALINTVVSESKLHGLHSMIYTFMKHPENILRKKLFTPLITDVDKKVELLEQTQLDFLYFDEFDENYSRMRAEVFVKDILVDKLNIRLAVCGFNYRFGYQGEGDTELLRQLGRRYNFKVIIIPPIKVDNIVISSTVVRERVEQGRMDEVFRLLGRHFSIRGEVKSGRKLGSLLGFPTANLYPPAYLLVPAKGVYITRTLVEGHYYNSVTSVGHNPTIEGKIPLTVETHLLDFSGDLYGKHIEVFFIRHIRGEKKFGSKEELICQISRDSVKAREFFTTDEQ